MLGNQMLNRVHQLGVMNLTMLRRFVDLYFAIVKYSLPDLEWSSRDLEEETLWDLYRAAYGFTYHGE